MATTHIKCHDGAHFMGRPFKMMNSEDSREELHFQKALLESLNEANPNGVLVVNGDSVVLFNRRFAELWTVPDDLLVRHSFFAMLTWMGSLVISSEDWVDRHRRLALASGEIKYEEIALKDGRTFELYAGPVQDRDGHSFGQVYHYHDITDRRRAEITVLKREERLNLVVEGSRDAIFDWDLITGTAYVGPRFAALVGFQPGENPMELGLITERIHRDDQTVALASLTHCINDLTADALDFDCRLRLPNGEWKWTNWRAKVASRDGDGHAQRIAGTVTDLTQRKAREHELKKLSLAVEQSPMSVMITNTESVVEFVNPHFCETTGYQVSELLGRKPGSDAWCNATPSVFESIGAALAGACPWRGEFVEQKKSGERFWASASVSALRDNDGQITHAVVVVDDATSARRSRSLEEMFQAIHQQILEGASIEKFVRYACGRLADIMIVPRVRIQLEDRQDLSSVPVRLDIDFIGDGPCYSQATERFDNPHASRATVGVPCANGELLEPLACPVSGKTTAESDSELIESRSDPSVDQAVSFASVSLRVKGAGTGHVELFCRQGEIGSREVVEQLETIADRLGVAIGCAQDQRQLTLQGVALASIGNAVFITDPEGRIVWANESFTKLSGYGPDEAIGKTPRILSSGQYNAQFYADLWRTIRAGLCWHGELNDRHKDGTLYTVNQTITPLLGADGTITHYVAVHDDITVRKAAEAQLKFVADHDVLTGLTNRAMFTHALSEALCRAKRTGTMLAVMFLDLDRFKLVNDSLGHGTGDKLLKVIAARLRATIRSTDVVARLGGDEFGIIQTDLFDDTGANVLAQKLLQRIADPVALGDQTINTTASLGITIYPTDDSDPEQLVKNADLAMYRAKGERRNGYQFYSAKLNEDVQRRLRTERELQHAIERGELMLHYQPEVDQHHHEIVGAEALIRWRHPERGLIAPGDFIPVAEDSGLIVAIGRWVLETACLQNRAWQDAGFPPFCVSVNISPVQFQQDDIVSQVKQALERSRLDGKWLELEITEGLLMNSEEKAIAVLEQLRAMGVQLSIDDFGTGYSSLNYLKQFRVDKLKIDRSFVNDLESDPTDTAIIRAVISIGHSLGLRVLAEGVETEVQSSLLARQGCDECQGFFFHRPMPADDLTRLLADIHASDQLTLQPVGATQPSYHSDVPSSLPGRERHGDPSAGGGTET